MQKLMRTVLATLIVAAGAVAPQASSAAAAAPAGNITTSHVATTSTVPAPSAPLAIQTGEYEYNCIGTDGSSFWIGPGRPTTDCHGSYLQKYLDGNLLATYNLAYGGGAAQNPPWNTGCVLAIAGGVALFVFPPTGVAAWVTLSGLAAASLLDSCVV
ncbi:hypothetical protein AB0C06_28020 [Micromonospora inaquosa]|uniref:Uncharacterized protein n=1 Tax=Micromonospora inaquosa TaxID=2203716 RepID=A0A3N9X001_9ACTN|nr:hypothetical protein [Micromonospora inaquosa]RQX06388.1 hypothetical protein DLJ59_05120 [Micromonospora inaquosa]